MQQKPGNSSSDLEFFYARLDQIRMSGHERLRARAHLASAEAIVETIVWLAGGAKRLLGKLVIHPIRRLATSLG